MKSNHVVSHRKFVGMAVTAMGAAVLAGCSNSRAADSAASSSSASTAASAASSGSSAESSAEASANASTSSASAQAVASTALVAVFSWSGNTLQVAERVAENLNVDLFRIEPETPYTTDYDEMLQIAQDEQAANTLPAIAAKVPNWDSYDTIYLGFPTWWSHLPQVVKSFASDHDFTGKVVYPFNTHGGSGFASTLSDLAAACPGADIRNGLSIVGDSVSANLGRIDTWVQESA